MVILDSARVGNGRIVWNIDGGYLVGTSSTFGQSPVGRVAFVEFSIARTQIYGLYYAYQHYFQTLCTREEG